MQLPELPDGYFWRLSSDSFGFMTTEIRRKGKLWSVRVEMGVLSHNPPVEGEIERTARWTFEKFRERAARIDFLNDFRKYQGDYGK
jgi:hypothetical protein